MIEANIEVHTGEMAKMRLGEKNADDILTRKRIDSNTREKRENDKGSERIDKN